MTSLIMKHNAIYRMNFLSLCKIDYSHRTGWEACFAASEGFRTAQSVLLDMRHRRSDLEGFVVFTE